MLSLGQPHRIIFSDPPKIFVQNTPPWPKRLIGLTASSNRLLSSTKTSQDKAAFRSLCIIKTMTSNIKNLLLNSARNASLLSLAERALTFLHIAPSPGYSGHPTTTQQPLINSNLATFSDAVAYNQDLTASTCKNAVWGNNPPME